MKRAIALVTESTRRDGTRPRVRCAAPCGRALD